MAVRNIVEIDEAKCDGCGLCVPSCAEGAIQIVNRKARLVSDVYCDGLGACLGHCPQGAITIRQREADAFDEAAAHRHVQGMQKAPTPAEKPHHHSGCPGMAVQNLLNVLPRTAPPVCSADADESSPSGLANWPIQLKLVPPGAPFLKNADLLLVADCVPAATADFHRRLLRGRPVVMGCPKLDDAHAYVDKLAAILNEASIRSLTVLHMEVPCCTGLVRIAEAAIMHSGRAIPMEDVTVSIRGRILEPSSRAW